MNVNYERCEYGIRVPWAAAAAILGRPYDIFADDDGAQDQALRDALVASPGVPDWAALAGGKVEADGWYLYEPDFVRDARRRRR